MGCGIGCVIVVIFIYFMFITRRTVLRVFGWAVALFITAGILLSGIFFIAMPSSSSRGAMHTNMDKEAYKIISDLRTLRGAASLFNNEFKTWPLPGQEASLDTYIDRPIVLAKRPRYAKVMLAAVSSDADDLSELYVGVELIPEENGMTEIQKKLERNARDAGLLQQPVSGDIYRSGLSIYMRAYFNEP
jgi:hypothetical protein